MGLIGLLLMIGLGEKLNTGVFFLWLDNLYSANSIIFLENQ